MSGAYAISVSVLYQQRFESSGSFAVFLYQSKHFNFSKQVFFSFRIARTKNVVTVPVNAVHLAIVFHVHQ